jgi:predicted permease
MFPTFGLQPALGRLFGPHDDMTPGAHPVAVLGYEYWSRRFARDTAVIGRTFVAGKQRYEIVGVAPRGFTGTEPGRLTDVYLPSTMNTAALEAHGWSWFRMWVRPKPGVVPDQIRQTLQNVLSEDRRVRIRSLPADTPQSQIDAYLSDRILLLPAGAGASGMQKTFRRPLFILAGLVALVLLIACTNVANLLIAQAMGRAREMALRISIGAGRRRLVQLVLVESALLAVLASAVGVLFAAWSAPFVVSLLAGPEDPVRLALDADWRAAAFGVVLAAVVTCLFGLAPAIRASSIRPVGALKGGVHQPAHRRLTNALIAAQMAFCVFVLFVALLFVGTFQRLANQPLGFSQDDVLVMQTETRGAPQPAEIWMQAADRLRGTRGVESVALSGWPLVSENRWAAAVLVPGRPVEPRAPNFLNVSPGFFETLRIPMLDGRDFRAGDRAPKLDAEARPVPGVGIVNETFARIYFEGRSPVGREVGMRQRDNIWAPMQIVALVGDAAYSNVRDPMRPVVYVPIENRGDAAITVRTAGDPVALAPALLASLASVRPEFNVRIMVPQSAFARRQMIRERLMATLSSFFAAVALLLAGVGLYGVLNYAVIQRRREIGIRMALGARAAHVVRRVTALLLAMVAGGCGAGLAAGVAFGRLVEPLLFNTNPTSAASVATPIAILLATAALAAIPPAARAVRIDPVQTLRAE